MKHAYLIIAHKDDYTFRTLLKILDDERNDIFIHMDIKNQRYNYENLDLLVRKSRIYHVKPRLNVVWGDYSQIQVEIELLKLATKINQYSFYHLLSGEDLPIKTQDYIHSFFDQYCDKEFIRFESTSFNHSDRVQQYHLFQKNIGRPDSHPCLYLMKYRLLQLQKILHVNRHKDIDFQKGANWFSITDGLAKYVIKKEKWIQKVFSHTECCDEVFLQTIVNMSDFRFKLYHREYDNDMHAIMRHIDWTRGTPYVFRMADKKELEKSDMLFARKFNCQIDREIIDYVSEKLCKI